MASKKQSVKTPDLSALSQAGPAAQPQADATQDQSQQNAPQADSAQPDSTQQDSAQSSPDSPDQNAASEQDENAADGSVNLHRAFSRLQESLTKLFDEAGVKRSFKVSYLDGQSTADHVAAVGKVAMQAGGLTKNLITSAHHAGGKGWGTGDGATIGHNSESLRSTIVLKNDKNAIAAIKAAKSLVNKIGDLIGDDEPAIKIAKSQLALVGQQDAQGMTLLDVGVALQNIVHAPLQAIARAHSGTKPGGHSVQLRAPRGGVDANAAPQDSSNDSDSTVSAPSAPTPQA